MRYDNEGITQWAAVAATAHANGSIRLHTSYLRRLANQHNLDTVTTQQIAAWVNSHNWRPNTRKSALTALRAYFAWATRAGRRPDDPTTNLPTQKIRKSRPRPVSDTTFLAALQRATTDDQVLMLLLARGSGLRRAEIAALHCDDLDGNEIWGAGQGRQGPGGGVAPAGRDHDPRPHRSRVPRPVRWAPAPRPRRQAPVQDAGPRVVRAQPAPRLRH
jgi:integrase